VYERELFNLHVELVKLQERVKRKVDLRQFLRDAMEPEREARSSRSRIASAAGVSRRSATCRKDADVRAQIHPSSSCRG
jgi:hypothetical protein